MKQARIAVLSLTAALLAFCASRIASACEEAINVGTATPAQMVARAELELETLPLDAARVVFASFPAIRTTVPGKDPVQTRALRVLAVAIVRTKGKATEFALIHRGEDKTPAANLEWAVQTLREIDKMRQNDPAVQADLGEALAKLPNGSGKREALEILEKLATKDLMGSPNAYAALAALRQERGDTSGASSALQRCNEMSSPMMRERTCKVVVAAKA
jgi:hypothetical protein